MSINLHTLRLYWQQARKFKKSLWTMLLFIPLASTLLNTSLPYFFSQIIGKISVGDYTMAQANIIYACIGGSLGFIANFIGFRAMMMHEKKIITELRNTTFQSLLAKDIAFYTNEKIGALTSKYIDFVRSETSIQDLIVIRTLGFTLTLLIGISIIATQSLLVAGLLLALIIVLIVEVRWSLRIRQKWRTIRRELRSDIHGHVADSLTNYMVVKAFASEDREYSTIASLGEKFSYAYHKDIGFVMAEGSVRVTVMTVAQLVTVISCFVLVSHHQIDLATVIFSVTFMQFIGSNIFTLGDLLNGYQEALLEASPMTQLLIKAATVSDAPGAKAMRSATPTVDFGNVSYAYEQDSDAVLKNISLHIPAGQKVGVVGHSGAGKTTLSHLVLRFADVTDGSIQIGGHDIRDVTQKSLRQFIAFVPQEPMLFHRSLRENIAYSKPDASDKDIRKAAKAANALEFIDALPHGLDTIVGERGVKFSGGQRQRIAIARAILKDSPILILDEATSALDSASEKLIQNALVKLMKGRTSIVIAHRLSTIAKLDRIIVLDNGSIVEDGTHSELLARGGIYATLWSHQSGGFIEQ